jgi:hypothetical protein
MRKSLALPCVLALACLAALAGCGGAGGGGGANTGAGEIGATIAEVNSFTDELLKKIDSAADASTGADEAQAFLDSRGDELRARLEAAGKSREFQESAEARAKLLDSEVSNTDRVSGLRTRHIDRWMRDAAFKTKLDRLVAEYDALWPRAG